MPVSYITLTLRQYPHKLKLR